MRRSLDLNPDTSLTISYLLKKKKIGFTKYSRLIYMTRYLPRYCVRNEKMNTKPSETFTLKVLTSSHRTFSNKSIVGTGEIHT